MDINLKRLLTPYIFDANAATKRDKRLCHIGNAVYCLCAIVTATGIALVQYEKGIMSAIASTVAVLMIFSFCGVVIQALQLKKKQGRPGSIRVTKLRDAFADKKIYQRLVQFIEEDEGGWDTNQAKALADAVYNSKMLKDGIKNEKMIAHLLYEQFKDKFASTYNPNSIMNARKTSPYDSKWKSIVAACLNESPHDRND